MTTPIEPTAEELRKFYDWHTKEPEPWDGSTFIDKTLDCACKKCSSSLFWLRGMQELARTEREQCAVLKAQNTKMREALERIANGYTDCEGVAAPAYCDKVAKEALSSLLP